jgi:hypothetical protein
MAEEQGLNTCGCCEGITSRTPRQTANPPGLSALALRVGTHGSFKQSMLAGLAAPGGPAALTTRADDDPAIALLDGAAAVLDVLTFYQERIANEGYLRTATERLSVLELARTIGYELKPGVAASTFLAFEMETAPSAPASAVVPVGTKVQSLPAQDEEAQTFETIERIEARPAWNRLRPQTRELVLPSLGDTTLCLQGTSANLKPGDALLLIGDERKSDPGSERWDFRRVKAVTPVHSADAAESYTIVELDRGLGSQVPKVRPAAKHPRVYALRLRANLFGYSAPDWRTMPNEVKAGFLGLADPESPDIARYTEWPGLSLDHIAAGTGLSGEYYASDDLTSASLKVKRTDATIDFRWEGGSPAPTVPADHFSVRWTGWVRAKGAGDYIFSTLSDDGVQLWLDDELIIADWSDHAECESTAQVTLAAGQRVPIKIEFYERTGNATLTLSWTPPGETKEIIPATHLYPSDPGDVLDVHLDAVYAQVVSGSWVVLSSPDYQEVYEVASVSEDSRSDFTLSAKTTRLGLSGEKLHEKYNSRVRDTVVFAQSEELPLAAVPLSEPVRGITLALDHLLPDLPVPRLVVVSGRRVRARLLQPVTITAADGARRDLPADADFPLVQAPAEQPGGQTTWTFLDEDGFIGSVATGANAVELVPSQDADPVVSEVAAIVGAASVAGRTELTLQDSLARVYDRPTVVIYGNVAAATHGETRREVLGSGDAARAFQTFALKQKPLTFTAAATAGGAVSSLEVRVNDVLWAEAASLYGLPARQRAYITRRGDDGTVTLTFGDGLSGARPPTGTENIVAVYRTGIGAAGMVKAGQLSLLMTRPLGVQKVTNPLPPSGAADPESREQARRNAPFTVLAMDRIVSLRDYEDFARAFAGIGKAQATWLWDGEQRIVHLTIAAAAAGGADHTVDPASTLLAHLREAVDSARDTAQPLVIACYEPILFRLQARLSVDPDYLHGKVVAAVKLALQQSYGFEQRSFGQPVYESEVLAVIQGVEGVRAVFLEHLYLRGTTPQLQAVLLAGCARREQPVAGQQGAIQPAQLLLLDPAGIDLTGN